VAALEPRTLTEYVNEVARAFGLDLKTSKSGPIADLRARLRDVRPIASAGSIGEVLDALAAGATYARTKRAERGRIFAVILLVFDLVALTGVDVDADDPEKTLKLVRRARR
jgi:hypothetical protein